MAPQRFDRIGLPVLGVLCALSCSPALQPNASPSAPPKPPPTGTCKTAADLRTKARSFFAAGKLLRARAALARATELCRGDAEDCWDIEVATLSAFGDDARVTALLATIEATPSAPVAARRAAAQARRELERPRDSPDSAMKLLLEASDLGARTDDRTSLEQSIGMYLSSWHASRPNFDALIGAAYAARALSDGPRAQGFFDRAAAALSAPPELVEDQGLGEVGVHAVSPDGRTLAVVHAGDPNETYIHTISVLDARTFRVRLRLRGHTTTIQALAISPDGTTLASGSQDNTARLWDLRTGEARVLPKQGLYVNSVAFSPNGKLLATAGFRHATLWDVASGERRARLEGMESVAFSPNGKLLAASVGEGAVLMDAETGAVLRRMSLKPHVRTVAFSPDSTRLAACSYGDLAIWDTSTGVVVTEHHAKAPMFGLHFSPNSAWLTADAEKYLWDAKQGKVVTDLKGGWAAFSPDAKVLAIGSNETTKLHDVPSGTILRTVPGEHPGFLPDGTLFAAGRQKPLRRWDPSSGALLSSTRDGEPDRVASTAFSPDGRTLALGLRDGSVRLFDTVTGALGGTLGGHSGPVHALSFSPDGELLASGSEDQQALLRDAKTGAVVKRLPAHAAPLVSAAFSQDSKLLATSAKDAVRVFEVETGAPKMQRALLGGGASNAAFSPDGSLIAVGAGNSVWHVRVRDGKIQKPLAGHDAKVDAVAYSPDGKTLASISSSQVNLWDEATGKLLKQLYVKRRPRGEYNSTSFYGRGLAFSSDGKVLYLGGYSGVLLVSPATGEQIGELDDRSDPRAPVAVRKDSMIASGGLFGSAVLFAPCEAEGAKSGLCDQRRRLGALHAVAGEDAGYFLDDTGHVELLGARPCAATTRLGCREGARSMPFEVCEAAVRVNDLFKRALAGEAVEVPKDVALDPASCGGAP